MSHPAFMSQATATSPFGPNIQAELNAYTEDMDLLDEVKAKLKALALAIHDHGNVMYEVIQVFSLYQDVQGGKIRVFTDIDNLDSTLRANLSSAQASWNSLLSGAFGSNVGVADAQNMITQVTDMQNFIKYEQSLGDHSILDQSSLANLQSALSQITGSWGKDSSGNQIWGNATSMSSAVYNWINNGNQNGQYMPQVKDIQDGFQTYNQSVSQCSASTNTSLQYVENQFKQGMGEENSAMQAYQKQDSTIIQNSNRSS